MSAYTSWRPARPGVTTVYGEPPFLGVTVRVESCWTTFSTWPAWTLARKSEYGMSLAGEEADNHVNSSAAVPTTSTSITMPLRKNLGFNRSLRIERATAVRRLCDR